MRRFRLSIGMELLILHQTNVEVERGVAALVLHPLAAMAVESNTIVAYTAHVLQDLGANQISLSRVG